jgi:acyl-CoA synthetase (NDP forming)
MMDIGFVFYPKSVAIIGVSSNADSLTNRNFLRPLLDCNYQGKVYPVNPHVSEVMGLKAYPSILDIPDPVDNAVCAVPAPLTPKVVHDCATAKVKVVTCFTAGFKETGEEDGLGLETQLVEIARRGGVRLIGPNCLGIHNPRIGVTFEAGGSRQTGNVGFMSQSGGNSREFILVGAQRGIFFSKGVSYGNAADLNEMDFLRYFAHDEDTKIIAGYIEGTKEPQRFLQLLRETTQRKPVIILKGGRTEAGTRAVMSHTSSLAGSRGMWDVLCRQGRAIQVSNLAEMADVVLAFSYLKPPGGRRIGIIGIEGGASVQAADDCEYAGLVVPPFPLHVRQNLRRFTPLAGTGLLNPVDTSADVYWDPDLFGKTAKVIADYDGVDAILVMFATVQAARRGVGALRHQIDAVIGVGRNTDKPLAIVLFTAGMLEAEKIACEVQGQCLEAGFPVFPSISRAARAVSHLVSYRESQGLRISDK